ncbi:MAG: hypothetical protein AB7S92_15180 [Parvibaculaceae bacterium]
MNGRRLLVFVILGGFIAAGLPVQAWRAEAAETIVKKTKKKKKVERKERYPHGLKTYPWGEPTAGWDDRCIFFFDTYDGWIPPFCRPYGRMH